MFEYFIDNNLISQNQSVLKSADSWVSNQILSGCLSFHSSKAFDKILQDGLVFKFRHTGVSGGFDRMLKDFLIAQKNEDWY